jgi:hypothetical protein
MYFIMLVGRVHLFKHEIVTDYLSTKGRWCIFRPPNDIGAVIGDQVKQSSAVMCWMASRWCLSKRIRTRQPDSVTALLCLLILQILVKICQILLKNVQILLSPVDVVEAQRFREHVGE